MARQHLVGARPLFVLPAAPADLPLWQELRPFNHPYHWAAFALTGA
jgi:CHAT domain-containing protein